MPPCLSARCVERQVLIAIAAALCCSAFAAEARKPVTIVGCVHKGTGRDSFVLTDVHGMSAEGSQLATNLYRLSTTKGLREHVNQKVEVSGTRSARRASSPSSRSRIVVSRWNL